MNDHEKAQWEARVFNARERVKEAERDLEQANAHLEQVQRAFIKACDHTKPGGTTAFSGFAYAFCEICGEFGG